MDEIVGTMLLLMCFREFVLPNDRSSWNGIAPIDHAMLYFVFRGGLRVLKHPCRRARQLYMQHWRKAGGSGDEF